MKESKRCKKEYLFRVLLSVSIFIGFGACSKSARQGPADVVQAPTASFSGSDIPGNIAAVEAAKKIYDETGKKVVLEIWQSRGQEECNQFVRDYDKVNPYVTVNLTYMNDNDYKTQARVNLAGGNTPDVWWINTGSSLEQFVDSGGFMDLTPYESRFNWKDRYIESAIKDVTVDGKLWALPFDSIALWATLYYNKGFFNINNLQYPVTVDDMIALAPKLRSLGQEPMTFYDLDGWYADLFFADLVLQLEDDTWVAKKKSGESKWAGDKSVTLALTKMKEMVVAGCFLTGWETLRQDVALPMFKNNQTPIMYNGTWFGGNIGTQFDFEVEARPMFQITPGSKHKAYMSKVNWALGIGPKTKYVDIALGLMDYTASPEYYEILCSINGAFSPIVDQNKEIDFPPYFSTDAIDDQLKPDARAVDYFHYAFSFDVCAAMREQIKMILANQISIEAALANWDAVTERVLNSN
jgi:ABC-type glycerol-3-phosphate transport system substrate-binding protein